MNTQQIISELNRAKVVFQQRAICTAMGIEPDDDDPSDCEECDGFGRIHNNGETDSPMWVSCEVCGDTRRHL